jgi:serine/threonine protein kinase
MSIFGSFGKKDSGREQKTPSSDRRRVGDKIAGRYEIYNILTGGMGIIYVCYDYEFKEKVALKTLKDVFFTIPEANNYFRKEAEVWMRLGSHENIVAAKFIDFFDGKPYIVLEYIPGSKEHGSDLSGWIVKGGLGERLSITFALQFCKGMIYVCDKFKQWDKDFVHRDIKPQNILITGEKILKITDFGLANISDKRTGTICGTPVYMAPEQFDGYADKRSDVYSFGIVLHQMLTGQLPFTGKNIQECEKLHKHCEVTILSSSVLTKIILKCIKKNPDERYQNFEEIKIELQSLDNH